MCRAPLVGDSVEGGASVSLLALPLYGRTNCRRQTCVVCKETCAPRVGRLQSVIGVGLLCLLVSKAGLQFRCWRRHGKVVRTVADRRVKCVKRLVLGLSGAFNRR